MGQDGRAVLQEARVAWESRVMLEARVNNLSAVLHVDSLKRRGSSKMCALSCFLRGACSHGKSVHQVSIFPAQNSVEEEITDVLMCVVTCSGSGENKLLEIV